MTTTSSDPSTAPAPMRPRVILPEHGAYDEARRAWNLAADQRPAAIVQARHAADVAGAVALAAEHGLQVAGQSTGHLAAALPDLDRTVLVRTMIGGVEIDPVARRARVGAGAIWQDVIDAATPHGLAALSGSTHDVGVVGYVLGGGLSWLARSEGLAANHVHAIEVVTADGRLVRCDAEHDPDLFWALRGGAGNFGVVTAIEIELFAIREVTAGMTVWPAAQARAVLEGWTAWCRTAPESATTSFRLLRLPALPEIPEPLRDAPIVVVDGAVRGEVHEQAAGVLAPLRSIGTPIMDTWGPMSPAGLVQIHMDPPEPVPGIGDGILLEELDAAAIDAFLDAGDPAVVRPLLLAELRQLGGAVGRAPAGAGARGALEGGFLLFAVGMPMAPPDGEAIHDRVQRLLGAMRPWATGTVYLNFAERGGSAADAFPAQTYRRLREVRGVWDPGSASSRATASPRAERPRRVGGRGAAHPGRVRARQGAGAPRAYPAGSPPAPRRLTDESPHPPAPRRAARRGPDRGAPHRAAAADPAARRGRRPPRIARGGAGRAAGRARTARRPRRSSPRAARAPGVATRASPVRVGRAAPQSGMPGGPMMSIP